MVSRRQKPSLSYFWISPADSRVSMVFMPQDSLRRGLIQRGGARWERGRRSAVAAAMVRILRHRRPGIAAVFFDLVGLGVEFGCHQPQPLGTGQVEATPSDAEAVLGLATQELGCEHEPDLVRGLMMLNALIVGSFRLAGRCRE